MGGSVPSVIVVMGVSGSGKTTVASRLAERLGWDYAEGDTFHSAANVAKMRAGTALVDEDRWPWLDAIAAWIDAERDGGRNAVVTCSALKRRYRDRIIRNREDVRLVYLKGDRALVGRRMARRKGHYMPLSLLESQFDSLEEPGPEEKPIVAPIERAPGEIVEAIIDALGLHAKD